MLVSLLYRGINVGSADLAAIIQADQGLSVITRLNSMKTVFSRPEYGLRCRLGVKPPYTHSPPSTRNISSVSIVSET